MKKTTRILSLAIMILLIASAVLIQAQGPLVPEGIPGEIYYAPYAHSITLDGNLDDWQDVPTVTLTNNDEGVAPAITFASAADDTNLYMLAVVIDDNIISGQHEDAYWNEDSVEFYINATGDLSAGRYGPGIAQITVPPVNIGTAPEDVILSGVNGNTVDAQAMVVASDNGWIVELAVPLSNDVWEIDPTHGNTIGFQVHLNAAASSNRDTKLIWSNLDTSDNSYQNPSLFGQLVFYEIGQSGMPPTPTPAPLSVEEPEPVDAPYRNADLSIEERVEDLMARMTLAEKIGQMTLVEIGSIYDRDIVNAYIGGLLSGGGGSPSDNTPEAWATMVNDYQEFALATRLGIPLIYGVDAVHGHNNLYGATIFPHNIGLGAANNPALMEEIGRITALETAATSIFWNYAPCVAVVQDPRWGRTYESYSEDTAIVSALSTAYMRGLQGVDLTAANTVMATIKHYVGDGGTGWGTSTTGDYMIDQGDLQVDEAILRAVHLPPYVAAIEDGARSIMVSFSSWNGTKLHAETYLVTEVLKQELGFDGFIVSDWQAIDQISDDYYDSVVASINAGVDMNMVPYDYATFIETLTEAVENGDVSMARIDDAVRRILTVKFEMGLFEQPVGDPTLLDLVGADEHRAVARQAVAETMVLLKNEGDLLPLDPSLETIFVGGLPADDIGIQSGGWTISWQGAEGNTTEGTTILEGIEQVVSEESNVYFSRFGRTDRVLAAPEGGIDPDVCIAVIGERPYAEGMGDSAELIINGRDSVALENMIESCETTVAVIVSGRPVMISDYIADLDAVVAAWLPGTEGAGVADVLFGTVPFSGTLPITWPRNVEQLPFDFTNMPAGEKGPLFPLGYGLTAD